MNMFPLNQYYVRFFLLIVCIAHPGTPCLSQIKKIKDVVVYSDTTFYATFPCVAKLKNGELMVVVRRAPNRIIFTEKGNNHVDRNSYLVSVMHLAALRIPAFFG